jgi:hypothetical protein
LEASAQRGLWPQPKEKILLQMFHMSAAFVYAPFKPARKKAY